jgi:ATP/maltotriose-dependent transcriptional regulator MalT
MAQISKQDFRRHGVLVARALKSLDQRLTELQSTVEAQALALREAVGITPAEAERFRARINETHQQIRAAIAIGHACATLGHAATVGHGDARITLAALGAIEQSGQPQPPPALLDLYDLIPPNKPEGILARAKAWWSRGNGDRQAA